MSFIDLICLTSGGSYFEIRELLFLGFALLLYCCECLLSLFNGTDFLSRHLVAIPKHNQQFPLADILSLCSLWYTVSVTL